MRSWLIWRRVYIALLSPWFLIIVIKTRLIYHLNTLELLGMTIPHCPSLEHLGTTWYNKTKLIYHLNTLELLGMTRLHWSTTWTLWNYLVWQDCIDLPLEHLGITWHDKTTFIYHLNTLELLGMPRLHWCTTWTLWNYLVWQDYNDLPLEHFGTTWQDYIDLPFEHLRATWYAKPTLIYHLNTLELLGMTRLHWPATWTPWNYLAWQD